MYVGVGAAVLIVLVALILLLIWFCRNRAAHLEDDDRSGGIAPELTPVDPHYVAPSTTTSDIAGTDGTETPSTDTVIRWADVFARTSVDETKPWV
jgi:hypothetical protein